MVGAALLLVAQSAAATQASYQIAALKQEEVRLLAEGEQLHFQLAQARAPKRVQTAAQALGLTHPTRTQFLPEGRSPIALAPRNPETRSSVWSGVFAVLTGVRPLDAEAKTH